MTDQEAEQIKAYRDAHPGVSLTQAWKAIRKMHKHTPKPNLFRFAVCKRGHSAMSQVYCADCGKPYCKECQEATK